MDLRDGGDHYLVLMNLPGEDGSNLQVGVEGRLLSIRVEPDAFTADGLAARRFETRLLLPGPVEGASAQAVFADGVLRVRVPKATAPESKKIIVKAGSDS
jgi:HSP20 family molecular chaperone IbpA